MNYVKSIFQKYGYSILAVFCILLFALDVLYLTILRDMFISPLVSFLSGTLLCVLALIIFGKRKVEDFTLEKHRISIMRILAIVLPLIIGVWITSNLLADIIVQFAIEPFFSDIIPAIQNIYIERLLTGENVYEPYEGFGNPLYPNYLPMQWLPFLIPYGLNIDFRWFAFGVFIITLVLWNVRLLKKPIHWIELFLKSSSPFLVLYLLLTHRKASFGSSVELMIVGYYLFLALTLFKKSTIVRSIGILLPLLSRFAFLFWLVFYAITSFFTERKNALQIIKWSTFAILLIYVLPFFTRQPTAFFDGLAYYEKASFGEWHPKNWQSPDDYPYHLKNGVSFSIYFYEYIDGSVEERFETARLFHKIMSVLSAVLIGLFFWWRRKCNDFRLTALVGLKLCITWFYAFLYLPFFYLYFLPIFLSLPIIFELNIWTIKRKNN